MEIPSPDWVENIVGKGEIVRYEQFLFFFSKYFQKLSADLPLYIATHRLTELPFVPIYLTIKLPNHLPTYQFAYQSIHIATDI